MNEPHEMTEFVASRLQGNPLLEVSADIPDLAENINGPSLIKVPEWVDAPLGRYYLYFAHHQGGSIRMAFADDPTGPFTIHPGGVLPLADSHFPMDLPKTEDLPPDRRYTVEEGKPVPLYPHIASPDVHVVPETEEIRLYYHGQESDGRQYTRVAVSADGLNFSSHTELLGLAYFRVFHHRDHWYALSMPGVFFRSSNGLSDFRSGPVLFDRRMRHSAVLLLENTLHVFFTRAGDAPEAILHSSIDLTDDWAVWQESPATLVLEPALAYEGGDLAIEPSARGAVMSRVRQLRDPAIYAEGDRIYLYYAIAGEHGIAVAELKF